MTRNLRGNSRGAFVLAAGVAFVLLLGSEVQAEEVFLVQMPGPQRIELEVRELLRGSIDQPTIHLFEVVKVGDKLKTFERPLLNETRRLVDGHLAATLEIGAPSANFQHFEVEVRGYQSATEPAPQNFRSKVASIAVKIAGAKTGSNAVDLEFRGPRNVDWERFKRWIGTAARLAAVVTIIRPDSSTVDARVTRASEPFPLEGDQTTIYFVTFYLDRTLPPNSKVRLTILDSAFPPNPAADNLPLALLRAPIGPTDISGSGVAAGKDRDPIRLNVLEVGGNYNTSIKLDPDPTTNEIPKRKNEATLDLRLASPTILFAVEVPEDDDPPSHYATWTPAELDARVSNGKLTGDSISTNTIRLFSQLQQVFNSTGSGPISFYRLVGEGGINADRDLRTIEYTGLGDFRWNPGFLNKVLESDPPPDRGTTIRAEFIPIGVELGHRQVRRDPLFVADDFIRRLRFAAKFELFKPPFFEFKIEDRMWWRGEFAERKFKNFFSTTFTYLPIGTGTNSSTGIFFSYERGSLPPFTTQRVSTLKVGFRVRRREW